jgi:hypothetical protein
MSDAYSWYAGAGRFEILMAVIKPPLISNSHQGQTLSNRQLCQLE